MELINHFWYK